MPVHRSGTTGRSRLATAAGTLLSVLSLLITYPGAAGASDTPPRGSAYLGMGVIAHDGLGGTPRANRAALAEGVDVSSHQGNVDWTALWSSGVKWAYVKATEGNYYKNPYYAQQYGGSHNIGMIRGAYHFATPDTTTGTAQADFFVNNGGGWTSGGKTLPGVLDIEWNPYGDDCFDKTQSGMVTWIRDFLNRYKARTGRNAVIYTATSWWIQCTGNHSGFGKTNPLWIPSYDTTPGTLPAGWIYHTMWQYTSSGPLVGDRDRFNGAYDRVVALAKG
ncbi:lysozyme [Streptomyces sp. NPDC002668]|uniref:lysozyme n=1 Tax=Streptomyces sp. NPDC002668 TaxID=3154422 RepID=UPI003325E9B2